MAKIEWLLFIAQLPATPSSLRVKVWRRLRNAGAASLQNGVWILPRSEPNEAFAGRLVAYIKENEASAQILLVQALNQTIHEDILARFEADRNEEYEEFEEQCRNLIAEIERETAAGKFTFAELEENEQNLQRLSKWIAKIRQRDFSATATSLSAIAALRNCHQKLQDFARQVYAREGMDYLPGGAGLGDDSESIGLGEHDED